jgi:hypothetical protein
MKSQSIVEIVYLLALALSPFMLAVVEGKRQPSLLSKVIRKNRGDSTVVPDSELHRIAGM